MAVTIKIEKIGGAEQRGQKSVISVALAIKSPRFSFSTEVEVDSTGDLNSDLDRVRQALKSFAEDLVLASGHPLQF